MGNHAFFQNRDCEFFPCHKTVIPEEFNCLFCFCPLYPLGEACGGNCSFHNGIKDCSRCLYPHEPAHYAEIIQRLTPKE